MFLNAHWIMYSIEFICAETDAVVADSVRSSERTAASIALSAVDIAARCRIDWLQPVPRRPDAILQTKENPVLCNNEEHTGRFPARGRRCR